MSRRVAVYRTAHFNAAHRLHVPQWTEAENQAFFGLCNNQNYHGHNYEIVVRVEGEVDEVSGYLNRYEGVEAIHRGRGNRCFRS